MKYGRIVRVTYTLGGPYVTYVRDAARRRVNADHRVPSLALRPHRLPPQTGPGEGVSGQPLLGHARVVEHARIRSQPHGGGLS